MAVNDDELPTMKLRLHTAPMIFLLGFAVAACVWAADAPKTETVQFPAGKDTVTGFIAEPTAAGRHPAVIVIHSFWGLDDWIKGQTQKLGEQGFVALAVDLYGGQTATDANAAMDLRLGLKDNIALRDVTAAYDYLAARKDVDRDHIGAIGWDMGGGYALRLAISQPRLGACVVNYGTLPTDPNDIQQIIAPVLGNFGALDRGVLPSDAASFEKTLKNLSRRVDIKIYDGARHGFQNPDNKDTYQPEAAADAWARSVAFLNKSLK
jgi:carboxymethylenebutenolidase